MSSDSAAPSPAAKTTGDGKTTAANVSAQQAVQRFVKQAEDQSQSAPQTADTKAPEAPAAPAEGSPESPSAAEQANASSPEAKPTEAPATPEESKPEGQAKTEGEADDVLSPEHSTLDAKTKEKIQRRIDKEVGKRKALEAQLDQVRQNQAALAAQLQAAHIAQQAKAEPQRDTKAPLPDIKDGAALKKYQADVKTAMRNVEALLDSEAVETTGRVQWNGQEYTKAELKTHLREFRTTLDDVIPAQQEYFVQQHQLATRRAQTQQIARTKFPFLSDQANPDVAAATQFFRENAPELLNNPHAEWVVGAYIKGVRAIIAEEAAKGEEKPKAESKAPEAPKPAPVKVAPKPPSDQAAVSTTGAAPRISPDAAAQKALQPPKGNMSTQAAEEYLARKEALQRARTA